MDVYYSLDPGRRLTGVGGDWNEFAIRNDAPELCGRAVIGRSVFDFIAGGELKNCYELLFRRVDAGRSVSVTFRCDSPTERRRMRLTAAPSAAGMDVRVGVVDVEERPAQALLRRDRARDGEWLTICGWCKKVLVGGRWMEIELAIEPLDLFERTPVPQLTHGLCDACADELRGTLEGL